MASADRADNEFWMRNVARNEPLKIFMKPSKNQQTNKQTKNTLRSHIKQINNAS